MEIHPIQTHEDYEAALQLAAPYFEDEPALGSAEADHFELLLSLIAAYEAKHFPINAPDSIEANKFRMEQSSLFVNGFVPSTT